MVLIPTLIVFFIFIYLGISLLSTMPFLTAMLTGCFLGTLFLSIAWMFLFFFRSEETETLAFEKPLMRLAFLSMGMSSFVFTFTLLRDLLALISYGFCLFFQKFYFDFYHEKVSFLILLISFTCFSIGFIRAKFHLSIKKVSVPIQNLPLAFQGFKIVQLSDVHLGTGITLAHLKTILNRVNELKPHLIAFTGDIIDGSVKNIQDELGELQKLQAPFGKFFVLGNHEYYWNHLASTEAMKAAKFTVLTNENFAIQKEGQNILIAGVTDPVAPKFKDQAPDLIRAFQASESELTDVPRILLCHQPVLAKKAAEAGFSLMLSGHTHGGQFIPWSWFIHFAHAFHTGLSRVNENMFIYVSHGTGYWGPPIRFGTSSEITEITLYAPLTPAEKQP